MEADPLLDGLFASWRLLRRAIAHTQQATLTFAQFWLLRQLWQHGPLTIGELATALASHLAQVPLLVNACKRRGA